MESGLTPSHSLEDLQRTWPPSSSLEWLRKGNTPLKRGTSAPTVAVGKSLESSTISKPITECIQVSGPFPACGQTALKKFSCSDELTATTGPTWGKAVPLSTVWEVLYEE